MSKRPSSSEGARHGDASQQQGKRQQTHDPRDGELSDAEFVALGNLADNADDLIAALEKLKQCRNSINERRADRKLQASKNELAALTSRVASHIEILSQPQNTTAVSSNGKNALPSNVGIPSMAYVTAWRSSEVAQQLPPPPAINDKKLEELVFTHPGFVPGSSPDKQYERLEWLGDAYLELIATALIDKTFLTLPSGRCSQIRERLIRNTTLAAFFREYGFETRAKLPTDFKDGRLPGRGSSSDKDLVKTQADMFEAYVAAIILSDPIHGVETVISWLKALWSRSLYDDIKKAEQTQPMLKTDSITAKRTPKEELSARIVVKGIIIRYEKTNSNKRDRHLGQELFSVAAYLDGWGETNKFLGVGSALNVKEAGQKAATEALQNKKLLKVFEQKKKAFMEAKEAAAQQEAPQ